MDLTNLNLDTDELLRLLDRADCEESLPDFVHAMWPVIEPSTPLVWGWAMDAICEHLEAVTYGDITRLLINVPPGSSKSLLCNVFWPAWEWARQPHLRYLSFSYAAHLTERDNRRFRDVIQSPRYQRLFGDRFKLAKQGEEYVSNDKTGFKLATSTGGVGTGERGDRVIFDDPHNVKDNESDTIRDRTVNWFATAMSNRLNDMEKSAIVGIMQRVHEGDVSGYILDNALPYEHLMIPAEYDPDRKSVTCIGWEDPRTTKGETFWSDRFPMTVLNEQKKLMGPFGYEGQYQQCPTPAGGGIIKRDWWQPWDAAEFPPMDYIIASVDTAYTEKKENDPSAMTVWGVFTEDPNGVVNRILDADGRPMYADRTSYLHAPKLMLMNAWSEHLEFHELVNKVAITAKRLLVDKLLIEGKASGISVAQEIQRLYSHEGFGVQLINPGSQDKVARLYSVQHIFADMIVHAPDKEWAEKTITQVSQFPKSRFKDLTDTVSQAVRHLRDIGLLTRAPEREHDLQSAMRFKGTENITPLYPS